MRMRRINAAIIDTLVDKQTILSGEGGSIYSAVSKDGKVYLVIDEGTMTDFLSEEDLVGMELTKVYEFENQEEMIEYINKRGWK
ncbi:hypothetical protein ACFL17_06925 [Pseudomonadota bacterium]